MSTTRADRWTDTDVARLRQELRAREPDWAELARAIGRSERGCREKAKRLGLLRPANGAYSEIEIARRLGVSGTTVHYWRGRGWLRGLSRRALRSFLREHPEAWGERVDRAWLVDVLAGSSGGGSGKAA